MADPSRLAFTMTYGNIEKLSDATRLSERVSTSSKVVEPPGFYASIKEEYEALTSSVGLVDRSYLSKLKLVGRDVVDLLQRLSTNDLNGLSSARIKDTVLTDEKGRVIDLVTLYAMSDSSLLLTCHAPAESIRDWIQRFVIMEDVTVIDLTRDYAVFSFFGPKLQEVLPMLGIEVFLQDTSAKVSELRIHDVPVIVSEADPILSGGVNLFFNIEQREGLWKKLLNVGKQLGLRPCGMGALEIRRIEKGVPIYGRELTEDINPLEAGLERYVSFTKGCYIGQEVIARLDTYKKLQKRLMGIQLSGEARIAPGARMRVEGQPVGAVTSVSQSMFGESTIALGYVRTPWAYSGNQVLVALGSEQYTAKVVELPFRE